MQSDGNENSAGRNPRCEPRSSMTVATASRVLGCSSAPGTVLAERFEILAPLGGGGMGVVFEALDRVTQ